MLKTQKNHHNTSKPYSTITVGTLLENDSTQSRQIEHNTLTSNAGSAKNTRNAENNDETNERDITFENTVLVESNQDNTAESKTSVAAANDDTHERTVQYAVTNSKNDEEAAKAAHIADDTATQVISHVEPKSKATAYADTSKNAVREKADNGTTKEADKEAKRNKTAESAESTESAETAAVTSVTSESSESSESAKTKASAKSEEKKDQEDDDKPETVIIPLLEREERAMRDAQADLDE